MLSKEELYGCYIKKSSKITEDVFNKIMTKLRNLNLIGIENINFGFDKFDNEPNTFIFIKPKDLIENISFGASNHKWDATKEITIEDILGPDYNIDKPKSTNLTPEDLEISKFYYWEWEYKGTTTHKIIFKHSNIKFVKESIDLVLETYSQNSGESLEAFNGGETLRFATQDEINHFVQCSKAGKYVEPNTVKDKEESFVLPEYWCIKNNNQVIRNWFAEKYNEPAIKDWSHTYIGYDNANNYNGVHGCSLGSFLKNNIEITFDQFKKYVLKEGVKDSIKKIKKWSPGTYVVITDGYHSVNIGDVHKIDSQYISKNEVSITDSIGTNCLLYKRGLKWFATEKEAEVFAKTLKESVKKGLTVDDLIEGKYYKFGIYAIFKYRTKGYIGDNKSDWRPNCNNDWNFNNESSILLNATSTEIKHYNVCSKQDKFIPESELDKYDDEGGLIKIIPKYVEFIASNFSLFSKGKIYPLNEKGNCLDNNGNYLTSMTYPIDKQYMKPSTKEAYEAQQITNIEGRYYTLSFSNGDPDSSYEKIRLAEPNEIPVKPEYQQKGFGYAYDTDIDLKNTKIWIGDNPELCEKVQKRLFELGCKWHSNDTKIKYLDSDSLYINKSFRIAKSRNCIDFFKNEPEREISLSDIGVEDIPKKGVGLKEQIKQYPYTPSEVFWEIPMHKGNYFVGVDPVLGTTPKKEDKIKLKSKNKKRTLIKNKKIKISNKKLIN